MPVEWTGISSTSCNLNEKKFKYHMISQVKTKSVWVSSQLFINIHRFGVFQYPTLVWHNARFSWKNVAHILIKSIFIHVFISELVLSNILVNWRRLLLLQSSWNFGIYTDFDLECRNHKKDCAMYVQYLVQLFTIYFPYNYFATSIVQRNVSITEYNTNSTQIIVH